MSPHQNLSQGIADPFQDTDSDLLRNYEEEAIFVIFNYFRTVTDCIKLFICTCVIAVDLFMIYIFCRFKSLRKSKTNRYILHYAICNFLYLLTPVFYVVIEAIPLLNGVSTIPLCIIIQIENTCLTLCFLFAFGLGIDWLVTKFLDEPNSFGEKIYEYSIPILFALGLTKFLVQSTFCFLDIISIRHIFSVVVYGSILAFTLLLDYLSFSSTYTKKPPGDRKNVYSLMIMNIIIFSWLPMYIYHGLTRLALGNENFELVLWYTVFLAEWLADGNSLAIFIVLVKLSKKIRVSCCKVFRRSVRKYSKQNDLDVSLGEDVQISDNVYI